MITLACFWEYVPYCFRNLIIWSFLGLRQVCSIESASPSSLWPLCSCQLVADVYCGRHSVFVLDAFANLRKGIISSVMSLLPSARPLGTARLSLDRFSWNFIWVFFKNMSRNFDCMKTNIHLWYRSVRLRMRNVSHKSCWEIQNTHSVFNNGGFFPPKVMLFVRECGKKNMVDPNRP